MQKLALLAVILVVLVSPSVASADERFDGTWTITRQHVGCCQYSKAETVAITTDATGVTRLQWADFLNARGTVTGSTLAFIYGIGAGDSSTGLTGSLTIARDDRTMSGTFNDSKTHHRGTLTATRLGPAIKLTQPDANDKGGSAPFDGAWTVTRQHQGCCRYTKTDRVTIVTDSSGVSRLQWPDFLNGRGTVSKRSLPFIYGVGSGNTSRGLSGTLTISADGMTVTGSFSDSVSHHRGTLQGKRIGAGPAVKPGVITRKPPVPVGTGGATAFDGTWSITRRHEGCCTYAKTDTVIITTDPAAVTRLRWSDFNNGRGTIAGNTLTFIYGVGTGDTSTGLSGVLRTADGKIVTGSFTDTKTKHHGSLTGKRL